VRGGPAFPAPVGIVPITVAERLKLPSPTREK
jgi:hypothetical protein